MQSATAYLLFLAIPFFCLIAYALWIGCGVDAKLPGVHFKARPKLTRRRRKKPERPAIQRPPDKPG